MTESNTTELAAVAATSLAKVSIKETVLAQFRETEATLTDLANRYRNVVYDVRTPKGMKDAIAARADLRDNGRLFVTKAEARIKSEVNDLKRVMANEAERLVAIVLPIEEAVDQQIKAEERRKAEEKAERDRIEAERVGRHRVNIDKLKGYVERAKGQPVAALEKAIAALSELPIGAEFEEFEAEAKAARDATVQALRDMAQAERDRLARETESKRLADELAKARAEIEALRQASPMQAPGMPQASPMQAPGMPQASPVDAPDMPQASQEQPAQAQPVEAKPLAPSPVVAQKAADVSDNDMLINLGEINKRLGIVTLSSDALAVLGFAPLSTQKNAKLYRERDVPAMLRALAHHILNLVED